MTDERNPGLLARWGAGSPLLVTAVWAVGYGLGLIPIAIGTARHVPGLLWIGLICWLAGFALAYTITTWYRDDDVVAAGFLLGVSGVLASLAVNVIVMGIMQGAIGGALLAFGMGIIGIVGLGILAIIVCIALVALGRLFWPGVAKPVPPARRRAP